MNWAERRARLERRAVSRDFAYNCMYVRDAATIPFIATRHEAIDFEPMDDTLVVPSETTVFEVEKANMPIPVLSVRVRGTTQISLASDVIVAENIRYTVLDFKEDSTKVHFLVAPER